MSIPQFSHVIIGFGNNKGETTTRLLSQQAQKINRVSIKSNFGANPKISIKPVPEINLNPFTQMIYKKRDENILKELINSHRNITKTVDFMKITKAAQEQFQELASELELLKNVNEKDDSEDVKKIATKTACTQAEAKKYLSKYKSPEKAIEMVNTHKKLIEQFAAKFQCNKQEAKEFLEANNFDMSVIG